MACIPGSSRLTGPCRRTRARALLLLLTMVGVLAQPVLAAEARERLDRFIDEVDTFQADFEQTLYDADSQPLQHHVGTVRLKRPGRFVWDYEGDGAQQIVADGERIWLYDRDLEQVTVNRITERLEGTPLSLLMRTVPLEQAFQITELGEAEGIQWLELTPRSESSDFEQVFIGMNEDGLAAMELRDNFGQATQIRFSDFQAGVAFEDSLFDFEVPDGVDVIGLDGN